MNANICIEHLGLVRNESAESTSSDASDFGSRKMGRASHFLLKQYSDDSKDAAVSLVLPDGSVVDIDETVLKKPMRKASSSISELRRSSTGMNTARPPPPPVRSRESTVPNTRKSSMAPVCEQSKLEKSDSDCTYVSLEEIIEMRKILGENEVEVS
eukprot:m.20407 g.20407  ORF g.20407 m.20407 type:complete len:156 (-) comp6841_c0_seq1:94-561(-)